MLTCNGYPVIELRLALPRVGAWVADVELDSEDGLTGSCSLEDGAGNVFLGTVRPPSGVQVGRTLARIVGGKGGLSRQLSVRHYLSISARQVVGDLLAEAGETLDPYSDPLATQLDSWSKPGPPDPSSTAGAALSVLCGTLGLIWRVLPNGNVWIGTDSTEPTERDPDTIEISRHPSQGMVELGVDSLWLHAGALLDGERIGRIEYTARGGDGIRATYWIAA